MTFLAVEPLRIMLSSRCQDLVPWRRKRRPMAELRRAIKTDLERQEIAGERVFEVWIHEDEAVTPGDLDSWRTCIDRARRADLVLVLYNGRAGWVGTSEVHGGEIGVCHAELAAAFDAAPRKVRSVQIRPLVSAEKPSDRAFQAYFERQRVMGAQVETGEQAIAECRRAAAAALLDLARAGVGAGSRGRYYAGEALAWSRMDYATRRAEARAVLRDALNGRPAGEHLVVRRVGGQAVGFVCDCIPAAMSTPAARELVGQPFLHDHLLVGEFGQREVGPVHVIACHRGVTEAQALKQLGFPDAVVVSAPFGVYVADDVQKIQMVFVANCRDRTSTTHSAQEFVRWLEQQGEDRRLAERAAARRRISLAVAKEAGGNPGGGYR